MTSLVGTPLDDGTKYKKIVGGLQYLCLPRPNIAFDVNKVSQYIHWSVVKCILRYVPGTLNHGINFKPSKVALIGFSNADWASCLEDRKSTSGYCVYLRDNLIGWTSKTSNGIDILIMDSMKEPCHQR